MSGKRDLTDLVEFLKAYGGLYQSESRLVRWFQKIRLIFFMGMLPFIYIGVYRTGLMKTLNKSSYFAFSAIYVSVKAVSYYTQRARTERIIRRLVRLIARRTQPQELQLFHRYSSLAWKVLSTLKVLAVFYVLSYFGFPMCYDLVLWLVKSEQGEPYSFPHPLDPLVTKVRSLNYYMMWLASGVWCYLLLRFALVSVGFLLVAVCYCCIELRHLAAEISHFGSVPSEAPVLAKIVRHYQDVLELFRDMKAVMGLPMAAQNAVGGLLLTLLAYNINHNLKGNPMLIMLNAFALIAMTMVIFLTCLVGDLLQSESNKIYTSFCDLPYNEMSPNIRRTLSFMILISSRPMVIHYKGKIPLSLRFFQEIMNSCYSYTLFLNSME